MPPLTTRMLCPPFVVPVARNGIRPMRSANPVVDATIPVEANRGAGPGSGGEELREVELAAGNNLEASGVHVALLRGINVGGKNKLPMKELAAMFADVGAGDVQTYIQSGNVAFRAQAALAELLPAAVTSAIAKLFGFEVPVVMRTAEELRKVATGNPFLLAGADESALHVAFLMKKPGPAEISALDPGRFPPDELELHGREIYLRCPSGIARTRLTTAYFDSKLGTTSTVRNWRTVLKMAEMSGA